ncbi:eukaryotic translation initiation factor 3 subunit J [Penicillium riverlandense]|uniref:eukaryotic translation initiation factor 3 subunit J n=1 Tax=Penicillium riverlandense TaxID=1903569 RepID=UPI002548E2FC|nr:eukaryotic translation initiation factor 3 subunit J [Penicillium riverlandense]KAJ5818344.1 eukaryotic translation initiation factor 3 subunit J [Penicillium riverlandense]
MPPSKWDEEESSSSSESDSAPVPVAARRRFDDEEDDDVLDSWDAAEDSEVEREKAKKAAEAEAAAKAKAAANKKTKAQRIEEHREERRKQADEDELDVSEDEAERRERLRRTEQEADLKHAQDLIGDIDLNRKRGGPKAVVVTDSADPTNAIDLSAMPLFRPTTKAQFAKLSETLVPLLTPHSKKPHYSLWAQDFVRQLVKEMPSGDIKKIASALTTASNEKMREERAADKGNKKSKAAKTKVSVVTTRENHIDNNAYDGDDGLGDDDFM